MRPEHFKIAHVAGVELNLTSNRVTTAYCTIEDLLTQEFKQHAALCSASRNKNPMATWQ
jgi:hypothetical protein